MDRQLLIEVLNQGHQLFHDVDDRLPVTIQELETDPVFVPISNLLFVQPPQPDILGIIYRVPVLKSNAATEKVRPFSPRFTGGCNFVGVYTAGGTLQVFWGIQPVNEAERATAFLVSRTQSEELSLALMNSRSGRGVFNISKEEKFLNFPVTSTFSALSQSAGSKRVTVFVAGTEGRYWLPTVLPRQLRAPE